MALLYWEYDTVAQSYPGFSLRDIKQMPTRERRYWKSMASWRGQAK